ncbi:hypothetical protein LTR16_000219 [Cryomyces antarcticus]|uniref:Xylanolytic transcriptional activator regulatory domain-containing protein n=1 Tax=Cryomyces antarcticus TaxID=329879 RepID=A0ABR0M910_9PEZI|nr:hypothetical protein LTR16_000219 [Cryomyces antarcticus]
MTSIWSEISDPSSSTEQIHSTQGLPPTLAASSLAASRERRKKLQQPRQLLSCTKCRERKVKVETSYIFQNTIKNVSLIQVNGIGEDGDYGPIQQSYELRKLRLENQRLKEENERLKEELQDLQQAFHGEKGSDSSLLRLKNSGGSKIAARQSNVKQRNFKGQDPSDSLYFGSPGLANIIQDFANLQVGSKSLTHTMPRGAEIYATHDRALYPFPTMWLAAYRNADGKSESCIPALLNCLPPRDELFGYLDAFQRRAQSCSFPHTPDKITRKEVERFLDDAEKNAFAHPDMLALIFAALAEGLQNGVYDKNGGKWVEGAMQTEADRGDMYIAAAMQALRMASFTNSPTLLSIQTLILIGPYLTNSGRFLDAWTLFGTTIRLAHSIGLHRNPRFLDPAPPLWCEPESPSRLDASLNATRDEDLSRVEQAYAVFVLLKQRGVHKLAGLAVQRISVGLLKLRNVYRPRQPQNMPPTSRSEGAHVSTQLPSTRTVPGARSSKGKEKAQTLFADTAMGNTGMFLLEDPGLQSFVPESFAPLSWDMAGSDLSVHSGPPSFVMPSAPAAPPDFHGPAYATGAPLPQGHPFPAYGAGQEAMFDMQQTNSTSYLGHEGVSSMGLAGYPGWAEEPTRWEASSAPHSPQQRPLNPRQRQRQQQRRSPDFVPGAGRRMG